MRAPQAFRTASPPLRMTLALRVTLAVALCLVLALPVAQAHASRSPGLESPLAGSRLDAIPSEVSVVVTEPLDPDGSILKVTRSDGVRIDVGATLIQDASSNSPRMSVALRSDAGDGAYTVTLQTLSTADGHPWTESFGFAVGDFEPPGIASKSGNVPADAAAGRFLVYVGLSLGFGAALFLFWMPGSGAKWPARFVHEPLLGAGVLHTVGILLLIHATVSATHLGVSAFMLSPVGRILFVRLFLGLGALLLAAFAFSPRTRTASGPLVACILLITAGLFSSRLGHASLAGLPGVAMDFLHLLAAGTWVGGLAVLLWVLSNAAGRLAVSDVRRIGMRFGTAAMVCVIALALAGLAATILIVGSDVWRHPLRVVASPWGLFLALKVGLTGVMVMVAGVNRLVFLEPPAMWGLTATWQRLAGRTWSGLRSLDVVADARALRRIIALEASVGLLVLLLAGALTAVAPPMGQAVAEPSLSLMGDGENHHAMATLTPRPAVGGSSDLHLVVGTHAGEAVTADTCGRTGCLSATVAYEGDAAAGQRHPLAPDGQGGWAAPGLLWTIPGNATITIVIQTAEVFEDTIVLRLRVV